MPAPILTTEPEELVIATRVAWSITLDNWLPADGTLEYAFGPADGSAGGFQKAAVVDPSNSERFLLTLDDTDTTGKTPGKWRFVRRMTAAGEPYFEGEGEIQFRPNLFAGAVDTRSQLEKLRDVILAKLAGDTQADIGSYSWKDRSLQKRSQAELFDVLAEVEEQIRYEENERAIANGEAPKYRSTIRLELP